MFEGFGSVFPRRRLAWHLGRSSLSVGFVSVLRRWRKLEACASAWARPFSPLSASSAHPVLGLHSRREGGYKYSCPPSTGASSSPRLCSCSRCFCSRSPSRPARRSCPASQPAAPAPCESLPPAMKTFARGAALWRLPTGARGSRPPSCRASESRGCERGPIGC
eukprot:15459496-Alexandrium_andersonii.AAC.1